MDTIIFVPMSTTSKSLPQTLSVGNPLSQRCFCSSLSNPHPTIWVTTTTFRLMRICGLSVAPPILRSASVAWKRTLICVLTAHFGPTALPSRKDATLSWTTALCVRMNSRENHLALTLLLFGYLKKNPNKRIVLDSRPLLVDDGLRSDSFHPDFLDNYPDATEDVASDFPTAYIRRAKSLVCTLFSGKLPHIPYFSTYLLKRFAFF